MGTQTAGGDVQAVENLIVFSHLRWNWVHQRPQHLISRIGRSRRTFFVEEPLATSVDVPQLRTEDADAVTRVWLEVPGRDAHIGFEDEAADRYPELLRQVLGDSGPPLVWLYTPMALPLAEALTPATLIYDVMDDLASFKDAPRELQLRQQQALRRADVVFTGGRSLHRSVSRRRPAGTHLFPSGVEPEHYAAAVHLRRPSPRPVAGYVGVIDERLDLDLIAGLASTLPDWEIRMVGPIAKIHESELPRAANIRYAGPQPYSALPKVMAGFDVALMPFALNAATRSISPTKTLEYLAAGLPVVSTRVPDVVTDYSSIVDLQDDAAGFATACRRVLPHPAGERAERARPLLHRQHWDTIAASMEELIAGAGQAVTASSEVTA